MLILVDGAKGHTGLFLIKALLEKCPNCKIMATDLPSNERERIMTKEKIFGEGYGGMLEVLDDERVEFIAADLTMPTTLNPLFEEKQYDKDGLRLYKPLTFACQSPDYFDGYTWNRRGLTLLAPPGSIGAFSTPRKYFARERSVGGKITGN